MLLVLVLGIWGAVGHKIWSGLNPETPEIKQQEVAVNFNPKIKTEIDTFSVQTAKRDPFLGTLTKSKTKKILPVTKLKSKAFAWLPIRYHGVVKKQGTRQEVFVVSVNGQQHLLRSGQTADSISLVRGNSKAIVVRYKNQQKTVNLVQ